ncbi:hypothetical protein J6590_083597 [Homalodisca vitripennis]|nr:hypothetical protein J6590_083597 [Homalodisca vitripennis]
MDWRLSASQDQKTRQLKNGDEVPKTYTVPERSSHSRSAAPTANIDTNHSSGLTECRSGRSYHLDLKYKATAATNTLEDRAIHNLDNGKYIRDLARAGAQRVLVCCRAVISGASPHSQPCELFILAMELFVFSNVAFLQSVTHLRRAHYFSLSVLHHVEREVIRRVIEICDKEASDKVLTVPLAKATERAANYCKVSKQSIKRIRKEAKSTPAEKLMSPGKKRQRCDQYKIKIDEFDRRVIVNVIRDFYAVKKVVPTCKKLLPVLCEKIHFVWSEWALRRELKNMGFRWKKCGSKRKLLIERPDIVNWCWQSLEVDGVLPDMNAANRVIVVDIGS